MREGKGQICGKGTGPWHLNARCDTFTSAQLTGNQVLGSLRLEKHPEKTFIGKIENGFDFLGYHFSRKGL